MEQLSETSIQGLPDLTQYDEWALFAGLNCSTLYDEICRHSTAKFDEICINSTFLFADIRYTSGKKSMGK